MYSTGNMITKRVLGKGEKQQKQPVFQQKGSHQIHQITHKGKFIHHLESLKSCQGLESNEQVCEDREWHKTTTD